MSSCPSGNTARYARVLRDNNDFFGCSLYVELLSFNHFLRSSHKQGDNSNSTCSKNVEIRLFEEQSVYLYRLIVCPGVKDVWIQNHILPVDITAVGHKGAQVLNPPVTAKA